MSFLGYELYEVLLKPLESAWGGKKQVVSVPHRELSHLPIAVFIKSPPRLSSPSTTLFSEYREIDWMGVGQSITTLPSVGSLSLLRANRPRKPANMQPFAGFGDPIFARSERRAKSKETTSSGIALRSAPKTRGASSAQLRFAACPARNSR